MIRTLLIILALPMVFLATPAQAGTLEMAFILRTMIVPTADGHSVSGMPVVKVSYYECEAKVAEAEAAMHVVEDQAVLEFGTTTWSHRSFAGCLRIQAIYESTPTVTTQTPVLCVLEDGPGFDWSATCPQ